MALELRLLWTSSRCGSILRKRFTGRARAEQASTPSCSLAPLCSSVSGAATSSKRFPANFFTAARRKSEQNSLLRLMLVPPLGQANALSFFIQSNDKDPIQLGLEPLRNDNERSPPPRDSMLQRHCKDLVSKLNAFLCLRDIRPVFEDSSPPSHCLDEGRDLVSTVF